MACARADGGTFILGLHLMPAVARTPGCSCFVILGRDVTARVEARRLSNSLHLLLAKVFTSVDDAVAIVNSAGRIVMTNPRFDQLLGFEAGALEGRITPCTRQKAGSFRYVGKAGSSAGAPGALNAPGATVWAVAIMAPASLRPANPSQVAAVKGAARRSAAQRKRWREQVIRMRAVYRSGGCARIGNRWLST